jgi:hypothetical protein
MKQWLALAVGVRLMEHGFELVAGRLDSGAKRNEVKRSGFGRPFQARQSRLGMAS